MFFVLAFHLYVKNSFHRETHFENVDTGLLLWYNHLDNPGYAGITRMPAAELWRESGTNGEYTDRKSVV